MQERTMPKKKTKWLDEPLDAAVCTKILGAYDRAMHRAPKRDAVHQMLKRIAKIRADLAELEELATQAEIDGFALFNDVDHRLWTVEGDLKGRVPEASKDREPGNPGNFAIHEALARAYGLDKPWQFVAELLCQSGRLTGDPRLVHERVRKVLERMPLEKLDKTAR